MGNKSILEVYGRQGRPSADTMRTRKRVVGAMEAANGNSEIASGNLKFSNPSKKVKQLKQSTLKCYWNEFLSLSKEAQKEFKNTSAELLSALILARKTQR